MRNASADCICSAVILGICPVLYWEMRDVPWEGQVFPVALIILLAFFAAILGLRGLWALKKCPGDTFHFFGEVSPRKWCIIIVIFSTYVLLGMWFSFIIATFFFALLMPLFLENNFSPRHDLIAACFSSGLTLFFYFFFFKLMHINFPALWL